MLDLTLAIQLRNAGLTWTPANGDRFVVTNAQMVDETFHLADMVIEARELDTGTIFTFNGTTEWALDSVAQDTTVWLPHEHQLRESLHGSFDSLTRTDQGFEVRVVTDGREHSITDPGCENAYARALLVVLSHHPR
ncbi:MAG: pilus assembly protein CpaE [Arachnia sp.]